MNSTNPLTQHKDLIGWLATAFTILFVLSPIRNFITVYKNKNTNNLKTAFPYITSVFNAILWTAYQQYWYKEYIPAIVINIIDILFMTTYTVIYYVYCGDLRKRVLIEIIVCTVYTIIGLCMILIDIEIVGYFAMGANIILCYSPLIVIMEELRDIHKIPGTLIILLFIVTFLWLLYGISQSNIQIIVPNAIGTFLSIIQIVIYLWYMINEVEV